MPSADDALARAALSRDLAPDEELLWVGQPRQGIMFEAADTVQIPFSVLWTGVACIWEYDTWAKHAPWLFRLWGLPFVVFGFYTLVGRFFVEARRRRSTFYGVTNRRVLIVVEARTRTLTAVDLDRPDELQLEERADGTGSISFGKAVQVRSGKGPRTVQPPTFLRIARAREVFALVRDAQATSRTKSTT